MIRTLPIGMHYKECRILVEAAAAYYPHKAVGDAVLSIWRMSPVLMATLKDLDCYLKVTDAILNYQESLVHD